jgi:hypothetical protein
MVSRSAEGKREFCFGVIGGLLGSSKTGSNLKACQKKKKLIEVGNSITYFLLNRGSELSELILDEIGHL